ncbi:MOB kinase activator-like 2 isoform X1 [Frankliniella occidentalis]|uniref:MOB kinase activator-like 2 isoform X1 n=1 Tax=Frankliniella occidentalis TaxID=133901 RepID=A0A9C6XUY6_FRAOC|nr:MOB kinase activator-like 2 isoform X1 [Frankliniella occidentalis]
MFNRMHRLSRQWKARRKDRELSSLCPDDPKLYLEEGLLERKLPDIDLQVLLELPPGLDYNEWLASHTLAFFDHINLIYGTISEFCTMSGCPEMTGPGLRTYLWFDEKGKKTRVAAPQYIDYVMTFTQKTISDESIFPTKYANDFPSSFESIVRKILRLLFHVLAHLYHCHFREVVLLNLHAHLNCVFAHLTLFNARFNLIDSKETEILQDLVVALKLQPEGDVSQTETSPNTGGTGNTGNSGSSSSAVAASTQPTASTTDSCEASNTTANSSTSSQSSGSTGLPSASVQRRSSRCEDSFLHDVPLLNEPLLGRQETVAGVSH